MFNLNVLKLVSFLNCSSRRFPLSGFSLSTLLNLFWTYNYSLISVLILLLSNCIGTAFLGSYRYKGQYPLSTAVFIIFIVSFISYPQSIQGEYANITLGPS